MIRALEDRSIDVQFIAVDAVARKKLFQVPAAMPWFQSIVRNEGFRKRSPGLAQKGEAVLSNLRVKELVSEISRLRERLKRHRDAKTIHEFAAQVNELGYGNDALERLKVSCKDLCGQVMRLYKAHLEKFPDDAVAHNNIAVFHSNSGARKGQELARGHLLTALKIDSRDRTIHKNLKKVDIKSRRPEEEWHVVGGGGRGEFTLDVYIDYHGM